jgi:3-phosphoshikimate 1-carboxyvinyltransferase
MTAPLATQDTVISIKGDLVSKPYIDITLHLMNTFGVEVENQQYQRFVVRGNQQYISPGTIWWKVMLPLPPISWRPARLKAAR